MWLTGRTFGLSESKGMRIWFSQYKMGSLGRLALGEAFDPYGIEGLSHIQENRAG
jgi:hypothetical protein